MSSILTEALPSSRRLLEAHLAFNIVALIVLLIMLAWDVKPLRDSRRLAASMDLPKGQWLRLTKTLPFDPTVELLVVGIVLAEDLAQNWEHVLAGGLGAAIGALVGHYRYRIQYVRAVPEYKAIVLVRSREEYVALALLVLVRFAAEQQRIPVVGPLTLLITLLLSLVVFESITRALFTYRRYAVDIADHASDAAPVPQEGRAHHE